MTIQVPIIPPSSPSPSPPPISFSPLASSVPLFYVCTFLAIVQVHFNNDQLDNVMQMPGFQTLFEVVLRREV